MSSKHVRMLPSAGRLMTSLRDIGYDLPSAVADLVDNSLDAGAKVVSVDVVPGGAESWLRVSDDGLGMLPSELDEAMRYGAHAEYEPRSLGHFGLGLKTASLSQCRRLTVASRGTPGGRLSIRRWDLEEVTRRDSWDLERLPGSRGDVRLVDPLANGVTGTVVVWELLDRVIPRKPTEGMTARVMNTATAAITEHLAMVFHRFLDGEAYGGDRRLSLTVNGVPVAPWDPFARDEPHTQKLPPQIVESEDPEGEGVSVEVTPYVLPGQQQFSSAEAHRQAGGPRRWNRHQGFYVYRRDRLIQAGGWNRLRTLDEHAKLARISLDLPVGDEARFSVDVAKMRVSFPEELRPALRAIAAGAVAVAQERYRDHLDAQTDDRTSDPHEAPTVEAISISRDWPVILSAVDDVLAADPELRDRLLLRLANADADDVAALTGGAAT
jgi:hypothetical protein